MLESWASQRFTRKRRGERVEDTTRSSSFAVQEQPSGAGQSPTSMRASDSRNLPQLESSSTPLHMLSVNTKLEEAVVQRVSGSEIKRKKQVSMCEETGIAGAKGGFLYIARRAKQESESMDMLCDLRLVKICV